VASISKIGIIIDAIDAGCHATAQLEVTETRAPKALSLWERVFYSFYFRSSATLS
jgi:hypothetical protein